LQRVLRIAIVVASIVLAVLLARRALRAWSPSSSHPEPVPDLFHYQAEVELGAVRDDGVRLGGMLDLSRRDLDRACENDEAAMQVVRDAIASEVAEHPDSTELDREIAALPGRCFEPPNPSGPCLWAASELERQGELAGPAWTLLAHCPAGIASPFFHRADAPAEAVLAFVGAREVGSPWLRPAAHLPSQYARAVLELASRTELTVALPTNEPGWSVRYEDPAVADALVSAYESTADPARRLLVSEGLAVLESSRARSLAQTACISVPTMPSCIDSSALRMTELFFDAGSYVERHPAERAVVLADLAACAQGDHERVVLPPSRCLARLATLDWAQARAAASSLDGQADPALAGVVHALAQFPSAADLALALRSRELLGEPRATETPAVTVVSVMAANGRAWMLSRSSLSMFGHDRLARHLLRLGGLTDVEVDETLPMGGTSVLTLLGQPTRLRAFTRGDAFVAMTASDGDFYDLDAVVGLLNVVARVQGANVRYLVVVDPLAEEAIALGPPGELASAVAEGLLETPGQQSIAPNLTAPNLPF
jgi:hypothetical protein